MTNRKVGKRMGGNIYIHCSVLPHEEYSDIVWEARMLLSKTLNRHEEFKYTIIKINKSKQEVSFIYCEDFNTAHEPTVGDSCKVNLKTGKVTFTKARTKNKQIYHHKWLFVRDSYKGFDIEESKKRSEQWMNSGIEYDVKKIGNLDYWNEVVVSKLAN